MFLHVRFLNFKITERSETLLRLILRLLLLELWLLLVMLLLLLLVLMLLHLYYRYLRLRGEQLWHECTIPSWHGPTSRRGIAVGRTTLVYS